MVMPALRDAPRVEAAPPDVDPRDVLAALDDVAGERIRVELLPTFVGCPAIEVIRSAVGERLAAFGRPVDVQVSFSAPWTSDRISAAGRDKLRGSGFAPPPHLGDATRTLPMLGEAPVACPYCGSASTTLENVFGPTQCRSIRHCAECRQPFEAFKPV